MSKTPSKPEPAEDPVAVYDAMREAATRLMSLHAQCITVGGPDDPSMIQMRKVRAEARGVGTHDIAAQKAATAEFTARYMRLRES